MFHVKRRRRSPVGRGAIRLQRVNRRKYGSLVFHKGSYLVRIVAYQESGRTQHALLQLGQVIEQRLAR